ncbi:hypothetical protein J132_08591 [Termitomyces sp. J132]|nr:hypothetical protein J132_08591 [Termitomyces sp. J132]
MAECICEAKSQHWTKWLKSIDAWQIYTANTYITQEPTNFSSTRVPKLKIANGANVSYATTNEAKALALAESFFPPSPYYPKPLLGIQFFIHKHICEAVALLYPYKVPGPDRILNVVLKQCIDVLIDYLYFIFRAVFKLNVYHDSWLVSNTLVLCKLRKPSYKVAKAYQPIGLLNTTGKLLSTLVVADLSFLVEKHDMLLSGQFGGHPD